MYGGGGGGDGGAAQMEAERQARIKQGMADIDQRFAGFDNSFYDARKQAYLDYAAPQVQQQYKEAGDNLKFALARNGLLKSGASAQREGSLANALAQNNVSLGNAAQDQVNQLRQQVQDQKSTITNQLVASGDPSIAAAQAASATSGLQAPSTFRPIGNMFADWQNVYLGNMAARANDPSLQSFSNMMFGNRVTSPSSTFVE